MEQFYALAMQINHPTSFTKLEEHWYTALAFLNLETIEKISGQAVTIPDLLGHSREYDLVIGERSSFTIGGLIYEVNWVETPLTQEQLEFLCHVHGINIHSFTGEARGRCAAVGYDFVTKTLTDMEAR